MKDQHVDPKRRILMSVAISCLASVTATLLARKRSKCRAKGSTQAAGDDGEAIVSSADEDKKSKVSIDNHNLIFVVMPFAFCLDGFKVLNEIRASRSRLRALSLLRERYARGEVDAQQFERMRKDLGA